MLTAGLFGDAIPAGGLGFGEVSGVPVVALDSSTGALFISSGASEVELPLSFFNSIAGAGADG